MSSEVEICRMALDLLGDYAISDLLEDTKQARLCRRNYEPMRDAVVRAHPWNCAQTRAALPKDSEAPAFGWGYQYTMPADALRVLPLTREGAFDGDPVRHVIEGRKILTNHDAPLPVIYMRRVTDAAVFDPLMAHAISARLAWQIAFNLTGSRSKQEQVAQAYRGIMTEARKIDGMEGTPQPPVDSVWERSRY